ncbi:MAG: electron transfer flavoprotein subunit beta/FixA family protein [Clostridia bacterium]|nr:electron transfer flavoprotein subunit beta/FixA family protein [Clostridia bacterium]
MNIVVCVKQVPMSGDAKVDPVTGVMIRSSADTKLNPFDLYAIETALRLKKEGDRVVALTMGPPSAAAALEECIAMGIDDGILVTDRAFAGADVLATSYTLSQAIRRVNPDIIICGKQTTDGDTAQVGAEISEFLAIPCVSNVDNVEGVKDGYITLTSNLGDVEETLKVKMPCLISVEKEIYTPRLPSYKRKKGLGKIELKTLTLQDFIDKDPNNYGLKGSPTQVERIFPPEVKVEKLALDKADAAGGIYKILKDKKFI